jgi:methylmalonyl-CoA mutase
MAPVRDPDIVHANAQLLEDLKGGASGAVISYDNMTANLRKSLFLDRLFDGVFTDLTPLIFRGGAEAITIEAGRKRLENAHVHLGASPLDWMTSEDVDKLPDTWRAFVISDASVEGYGQPASEEIARIAYQLAKGFERHGADRMMAHTTIELIADQDAHLGIAKLRAARRVFARIAEVFDAMTTEFPIFAITSTRMMRSEDPWTNMLRVMNAGFGAVVGGADYVLTRPFTDGSNAEAEPLATPFAHRIARNMQLLMMEESHLGQVRDAAFGSYWHESLTEQLAQAAWARFQELSTLDQLPMPWEAKPLPLPPAVGVDIHPAPEGMPMPEVRTP